MFGMVVRERRRVAALARTASSLDEKAQNAEQAGVANEAAFRSYVEEKRDELASITQNHQEQILSLMTMLREESEPGATPADNSKIAVFANERIAALESQLRELRGEQEAKNMYRLQHEEAIRNLKSKSDDCEELQKKVNHMRSVVRQIRDAVARRNNAGSEKCLGSSPEKRDVAEFDGDQFGQWILGILTDALRAKPPKPEETKATKLDSLDTHDSVSTKGSTKSSPPFVRTVGRTHSSESDISDELPEWAGDIMADLEFIAQGKIPPSLRDSPSIQNAEQELDKGTVFERLADPLNFTGVQKQKKPVGSPNQKAVRPKPESKHDSVQVQRKTSVSSHDKKSAKAVTNTKSPRRSKARGREHAKTSGPSDEQAVIASPPDPTPSSKPKERRSVFERLLSPSSYTGTQKGKAMRQQLHNQNQQLQQQPEPLQQQPIQLLAPPAIHRETIEVGHFVDDKDDELLDELLASSDDARSSRYNSDAEPGHTAGSKVMDYTQQNVFERLQKTTTQSYEVKKNTSSTRSHTDQNNSSPTHSSSSTQGPSSALATEVASTSQRSRESSHLSSQENNYATLNVFERLQKTTTQAYAQKQHPHIEHNPVITK